MKRIHVKDFELDAINYAKSMEEDESIIYIRSNENDVFVTFYGDSTNIVNALIGAMNSNPDLYDLFSASVYLFEEDSIQVTEEDGEVHINNVFEQYNLICSAIVTMFAEKYDTPFCGWCDNKIGTKCLFGEEIVEFSDAVYDLETDQENYWTWHDSDDEDYARWCEGNC